MAGNLSKRPNSDAEAGKDGVGVKRAYVQDGNLYIVLTDNQHLNVGHVAGHTPVKGVDYLTDTEIADMKRVIEADHAHAGVPATGELLPEEAFSCTIDKRNWQIVGEEAGLNNGAEVFLIGVPHPPFANYPYFKVSWDGVDYQVKNKADGEETDADLVFTDSIRNTLVSMWVYTDPDGLCSLNIYLPDMHTVPTEDITLTLTPATGAYESVIKQLDPVFIPDYVSKAYVDSLRTHGVVPTFGKKTVFDLSDTYDSGGNEYMHSSSAPNVVEFEAGKQYAVNWRGKTYICTAEETYYEGQDFYVYSINNEEVEYGKDGCFVIAWTPKYNVFDIHYWGYTESCEVMPYSEEIKQLDPVFIPDYVSKAYVDKNRPCYSKPAEGKLLPDKAFSYTIPANMWNIANEDGSLSGGIDTGDIYIKDPEFDSYTYFKVIWNGNEYNVTDIDSGKDVHLRFVDTKTNKEIIIYVYDDGGDYGKRVLLVTIWKPESLPTEPITLEIIPATGSLDEYVKPLDTKFIPDYVSKTAVTDYVDAQTKIIKSDVAGLQQQINEEAHFRGYLLTNAKIQALEATPNDFAYSAESGTKWVYDADEGWKDTGSPVPDQYTPASNATPLMNGVASVGQSEEYARGDHRHPTDTTRASAEELRGLRSDINEALDSIIAMQNELIGGDAE